MCNPPPRLWFSFDSGTPIEEPVEGEGAQLELACRVAMPGQREAARKIKQIGGGRSDNDGSKLHLTTPLTHP